MSDVLPKLIQAVDALVEFVDAEREDDRCPFDDDFVLGRHQFTADEIERFKALDREVVTLATVANLQRHLPDPEVMGRTLDRYDNRPVEFVGSTRLPGDWTDLPGGRIYGAYPDLWREDLLTLRAAAEAVLTSPPPQGDKPKRRKGRPSVEERDADTLVITALILHHQYDNGAVGNYEPATNRGLAETFNKRGKARIANNALSRFLDRHGMDDTAYKVKCRDRTIGLKLAQWNRDMDAERLLELRDSDGA